MDNLTKLKGRKYCAGAFCLFSEKKQDDETTGIFYFIFMTEMTSGTFHTLLHGLRLKCPRCGIGKLFKSYLKQQDVCSHCAENLSGLRADDGPAWLTILIVGHIVVISILHMEHTGYNSLYLEMVVAGLGTVFLALIILPFSKGFFIAALWLLRKQS